MGVAGRPARASRLARASRGPHRERSCRRQQGGVCRETGPGQSTSTGNMATAGSAERPRSPGPAAAGRPGAGGGAPQTDGKQSSARAEGTPGGSPPCGHGRPACLLCRAPRPSGSDQRLRRRSDPERSSCRTDCDSRRDFFLCPALVPKGPEASEPSCRHRLEDRDEARRRRDESQQGGGVLSDSENEEPPSWRTRNISAFMRKTKTCSSLSSGCQRSQSCTDPMETREGKLKGAPPPGLDRVGVGHSYAAGILLSSENSRSLSAPITTPDRRLTWRAVVLSSAPPLASAPPRPERSISPESNDSISEELNHFKPIVCSPCTPPKRLADGRLLQPTIVKSTPRNLRRGLQRATSYEAPPAVLQKWRQIELDRQSLRARSRATLTSPVSEDGRGGAARGRRPPEGRNGEGSVAVNKRRLPFDPPDKQSVKIRVPALRYSSKAPFRGGSESTPESSGVGVFVSRTQSFSPYPKNAAPQGGKLVPKEPDRSHKQSTSRRGRKRDQKTKHLDRDQDWDLDRKRGHPGSQEAPQVQQERRDRALALRLQRQFDLENPAGGRTRPDTYFLRSWMSNQNRRRCGLRRSRRINKKH